MSQGPVSLAPLLSEPRPFPNLAVCVTFGCRAKKQKTRQARAHEQRLLAPLEPTHALWNGLWEEGFLKTSSQLLDRQKGCRVGRVCGNGRQKRTEDVQA